MIQQKGLHIQPVAITTQVTAVADDPMAWHQDADATVTVRLTDSTGGSRFTDLLCYPFIGSYLAKRYVLLGTPDPLIKGRPF